MWTIEYNPAWTRTRTDRLIANTNGSIHREHERIDSSRTQTDRFIANTNGSIHREHVRIHCFRWWLTDQAPLLASNQIFHPNWWPSIRQMIPEFMNKRWTKKLNSLFCIIVPDSPLGMAISPLNTSWQWRANVKTDAVKCHKLQQNSPWVPKVEIDVTTYF
jgi:hypothetical protein